MFKKTDPHSYTSFQPLYQVSGGGSQYNRIGLLVLEYHAALYDDVLVSGVGSVTQPQNQQFILTCMQRIMLQNQKYAGLGPITVSNNAESFQNYPALFSAAIQITTSGLTLELLDYSPRTVNTAVEQSSAGTDSTGASTGISKSSTTGSSYSQSSGYGASVTLGDISGITGSYEHSTTSTTDQSATAARDSSTSMGRELSASASMSIKDWGAYGSVSPPGSATPLWVFGQEYPWNAVQCRYSTGVTSHYLGQVPMSISASMQGNLWDGVYLRPPSELSMFGVNFVTKVSWRIYVDYTTPTTITLENDITYFSASHDVSASSAKNAIAGYIANVYLDSAASALVVQSGSVYGPSTTTLDLNILALDPLGVNGGGAVVGFLPRRFIPIPNSPSGPAPIGFKTIAATNDLMIQDTTTYANGATSGFSVSQAYLTAAWSSTQAFPYQITLYFKITDAVSDYTLFIKHWVTTNTNVMLTIVVNKDASNTNPDQSITITKYVTAAEAEGGESNILSIALRDLDFASIEYHDYLQLGLNSVTITMVPVDNNYASNCGYQIRAVSMRKG